MSFEPKELSAVHTSTLPYKRLHNSSNTLTGEMWGIEGTHQRLQMQERAYQGATGVSIPDATVRPRKHAATVVETRVECCCKLVQLTRAPPSKQGHLRVQVDKVASK